MVFSAGSRGKLQYDYRALNDVKINMVIRFCGNTTGKEKELFQVI